jgi:hypothetical protein
LSNSFYVQVDDGIYQSTENTAGPWEETAQHGGPPAALIGRAVERTGDREDMQVARITLEILRPVPVARIEVNARVARPGKNVEMLEANMSHEGKDLVRATAWRFRRSELPLPRPEEPPPETGPDEGEPIEPFPTAWKSYFQAIDWRLASGTFPALGPAAAWFRMRVPLLENEEPSPLTRVLVAADSGSGISAVLDWTEWVYVNTDLTVNLHRRPAGEWVCIDASTTVQPHGIGLAASTIFDTEGSVGRGAQSLYITARR